MPRFFHASVACICIVFLSARPAAHAQVNPVAGTRLEITYHPESIGVFRNPERLELVYAFNLWGTRYGTRLAHLENVLKPDSGRSFTVALTQTRLGWKAAIDIPKDAAVLSYYVTDGTRRDDNGEKTYTAYVYGQNGKPVKNAHFYMTQFLELAAAPIVDRVRESEMEVTEYPGNLRAYGLYFSLMNEQEKGSERVQKNIVRLLSDLQARYDSSNDFLNLAARTYYYLLHDVDKALEFKHRIPLTAIWPDVLLIEDLQEKLKDADRQKLTSEQRRAALLNAPAPDVTFADFDGKKHRVGEYSGNIVVLVFYALTSKMSVNLMAELAPLVEKYAGKGMRILAVNLDTDYLKARTEVMERKFPFDNLVNDGTSAWMFGVDGVPQTFVLDRKGVVRKIFIGYAAQTVGEIERQVHAIP